MTFGKASKLNAAKTLAKKLGLDAAQVMCLGDAYSDSEMIQWAGIGVAMGNAAADVQAAADWVTTSVDEDGILNALKKFSVI